MFDVIECGAQGDVLVQQTPYQEDAELAAYALAFRKQVSVYVRDSVTDNTVQEFQYVLPAEAAEFVF